MSDIPQGLKFTKSHEWVEVSGDGIITVGITDHAQELLGDMVFVDLPDEGADVEAETECAVVESVKAASDIYSPVNGEVTEINEELCDAPELVNSAPYGEGWIFKVKMSDKTQLDELLDAEAYQAIVDAEAH